MVKNLFILMGKLSKILLSGPVYKYKCGGCNNTTFYDKTNVISKFKYLKI